MMRNIMEFEGMVAHIGQQDAVLEALAEGDPAPLMQHYGRAYVATGDQYQRNPGKTKLAQLQINMVDLQARTALALYQYYMEEQTALFTAEKAAHADADLHSDFTTQAEPRVSALRTNLLKLADIQRKVFTASASRLLQMGADIAPLLAAAEILTKPDVAVAPINGEFLLESHVKLQDQILDRLGDLLVRQVLDLPHIRQEELWVEMLQAAENTQAATRKMLALLPDATPDQQAVLRAELRAQL